MPTLTELVSLRTESIDGSHDMAHIARVVSNVRRLAAVEGLPAAELRLVTAAAYVHDLDDRKYGGDESYCNARQVLTACSEGFSAQEVEAVVTIVKGVSYTGEKASLAAGAGAQTDRLTACVQDADRLDAIGATGIARCFCFGGARSRPLSESVAHFHDKLLLLKSMMKTEAGRQEAESRHAFMLTFLDQLQREWS